MGLAQTCFVQGVASGTLHGVLVSHDFDVRLVAASTWKWALKLARRGAPHDKNESRDLANRRIGCSLMSLMSPTFSGSRSTKVGLLLKSTVRAHV